MYEHAVNYDIARQQQHALVDELVYRPLLLKAAGAATKGAAAPKELPPVCCSPCPVA